MSTTEHLIEQQVIKHQAHLKHIDELLGRARQGDASKEEPDPLLAAIAAERDELERALRRLSGAPTEASQEELDARFGPMAVWTIMARLLEQLIERIEERGQRD